MKRIITGWILVILGIFLLLGAPVGDASLGFSLLIWVGIGVIVWGYKCRRKEIVRLEGKNND